MADVTDCDVVPWRDLFDFLVQQAVSSFVRLGSQFLMSIYVWLDLFDFNFQYSSFARFGSRFGDS